LREFLDKNLQPDVKDKAIDLVKTLVGEVVDETFGKGSYHLLEALDDEMPVETDEGKSDSGRGLPKELFCTQAQSGPETALGGGTPDGTGDDKHGGNDGLDLVDTDAEEAEGGGHNSEGEDEKGDKHEETTGTTGNTTGCNEGERSKVDANGSDDDAKDEAILKAGEESFKTCFSEDDDNLPTDPKRPKKRTQGKCIEDNGDTDSKEEDQNEMEGVLDGFVSNPEDMEEGGDDEDEDLEMSEEDPIGADNDDVDDGIEVGDKQTPNDDSKDKPAGKDDGDNESTGEGQGHGSQGDNMDSMATLSDRGQGNVGEEGVTKQEQADDNKGSPDKRGEGYNESIGGGGGQEGTNNGKRKNAATGSPQRVKIPRKVKQMTQDGV